MPFERRKKAPPHAVTLGARRVPLDRLAHRGIEVARSTAVLAPAFRLREHQRGQADSPACRPLSIGVAAGIRAVQLLRGEDRGTPGRLCGVQGPPEGADSSGVAGGHAKIVRRTNGRDEHQPAHAVRMLREIRVSEHRPHGMPEQRQALHPELTPQPFEISNEARHREGALGGRTSKRATLVVEHEVESIGERTKRLDQLTVLATPAAVQHHDRVAPAKLGHVQPNAVVRHVIPLLGEHGRLRRDRSRHDGRAGRHDRHRQERMKGAQRSLL